MFNQLLKSVAFRIAKICGRGGSIDKNEGDAIPTGCISITPNDFSVYSEHLCAKLRGKLTVNYEKV